MSEFREAEFEVRNGDIIHVYDDPSYLELLKHEREVQASITALDDKNAKLLSLARDLMGWVCCLAMGGHIPTCETVLLEERLREFEGEVDG